MRLRLALTLVGAALLAGALGAGSKAAIAAVGGPTCNVPSDYPTIQAALNVPACSTVAVAAGTYPENLSINRQVVLQGKGDSTVIQPPAPGPGITLNVGGTSARNPTVIRRLKVTGAAGGGNTGSGIVIAGSTGTIGHITFNNVTSTLNSGNGIAIVNTLAMSDITINNSNLTSNAGDGFRIPSSMLSLDGLTISDSHLDGDNYGMEAYTSTTDGTLTNVSISHSSFNNDTSKGMYFERLNNATLQNLQVVGSGIGGTTSAYSGIDINLKYASFTNITLSNSTISGSKSIGVAIKGRDDSPSYNTQPASLSNVSLSNNYVTGNATGISVGNNVTNVRIKRSSIQGNTLIGVTDYTDVTPIDASCNWWGAANGPGTVGPGAGDKVSSGVTFSPWLTKPALSSPCNGAIATKKSQCKDDGWRTVVRADGTSFRNQGDCIQYVNSLNNQI